jgi:hypothetical protein
MRGFVLAIAMLFVASPLSAQDGSESAVARTPEAAQAFLAQFLLKGDWVARAYEWYDGKSFAYLASDGSGWHDGVAEVPADFHSKQDVNAEIVDFVATGPCTSRLKVRAKTLWQVVIGDPETPIDRHDLTVEIDWSRVNPIKIREGFGALRSGGEGTSGDYWVAAWDPKINAGPTFSIHADKDKAERAAFAMNYLQQQCDPTNKSGF